jgi:molybdenum cofactor guanylyltransferase
MSDSDQPGVRAAILAGGRGSRLGGRKPAADLAGRPLIAYPLAAARAAGLEPIVVAKRGSSLPELERGVLIEPDTPTHPLLGILTAIQGTEGAVVTVGCDMPFVTAPLLRRLAEREPPAVAEVEGRLQPLLAVYGPPDVPTLRAALDDQAPLREAVGRLDPERVGEAELRGFGEPRRLAMSINTEADLAKAERLIAG